MSEMMLATCRCAGVGSPALRVRASRVVIVAAARSSSVAARVSATAKARVMASVSSGSRCHRSCKWVVSRSSRCVGVPGPPVQSPATSRR
ncbi:Uncharacterised protein [Mycobacteroides abscessus subsp. abscessus]|nr:Uncharacterised protein [Mycobacteroides abscessus subsp. abscessus]